MVVRSILWTMIVIGGMVVALRSTDAEAKDSPKRVLRHLVLYKFKQDVTEKEIQEVADAFGELPKRIDAVKDFEWGLNVSKEGKSEGLTHAFLVTFADEAGREAYLVHPAHQEYVQIVKDRREKVVVVDYWTQE